MKTNRNIDTFILAASEFHIEEGFAMSELANYLEEVRLLSNGVPFAELGIAQRRHASRPSVVVIGNHDTHSHAFRYVNTSLADATTTPAGSFAHLKLSGVMRSEDGMSSRGISSLVRDYNDAIQNSNIAGILLEVNTGGGESMAGNILNAALADSTKPVVVFAHRMQSAGVMATLHANEIVASSNAAQFGSIGTFVSIDKEFAAWYKQTITDIYADKSVNKNKEFRDFLEGNITTLKKSINASNELFLNEVKAHRPLRGDIQHTLSGATFDAQEAKNRGLVDSIGGFQYALKRLNAHIQLSK